MNKKIIEYKIVSTFNLGEAERLVNELIQDGWQPLGCCNDSTQVMVKYEDSENE